ncbi:MAG: ABC-F family ATP-binding cassette domain-containing protein [Salinivirgaceae bacterium]
MNYLQIENLSKSYGDLELFKNLNFTIDKDQRVALIAKNGAGKTSLLRILGGKDTQDAGNIIFRKDITVGYLEQDPIVNSELTVMDEVFQSSNQVIAAIKEYEDACNAHHPDKLDAAIHQMDTLKAWDYEVRIKQILAQLKITQLEQKVGELSGGQQKRLALANLLINEPDILILDEPTNHLDMDMIEWLEVYLKNTKSTLIMVTHDRYFLDRICDVIYELDNQQIYRYRGNYSYFLEKREERILNQNIELDKARSLYKKELDWFNRMPSARSTKAKYRVDSFYEIQEVVSRKNNQDEVKLDVQSARLGSKILEMEHLTKSFGETVILNDFTYKFNRFEKIGVVCPNGCGKSTFLNLISGLIPLDSGKIEIGSTVVFGYYTQQGIQFDENKRVIDVIQELSEDINLGDGNRLSPTQFLNYFLFPPSMHYAYVYKLSGGEKRRLFLMTVLMKNPNFLILDEPTNDLDIMTLNVLEGYLQNFKGCVLIVSHDRYFMDKIVDHLFVFEDNGKIKDFPGNYSQYRDWKEEQTTSRKKAEKQIPVVIENTELKEKTKLTFKEKQEYELLNRELEQLEAEKIQLFNALSDGSLQGEAIVKASQRFSEIAKLLDEKGDRWLQLSEFAS